MHSNPLGPHDGLARDSFRDSVYRELPLDGGSWPGSETLGDLLDDARYACAVYGKWHVGERDGRWPTDHGFAEWYGFGEWYGPPCTYGEALLPTDPWYDLPSETQCRGWSRAHADEPDVAERDQLTLEVRRDCDVDYLRRASAFMGDAADHETPFLVYFNHSLAFKGRARDRAIGPTALLELDSDFGSLLDLLEALGLADDTLVTARIRVSRSGSQR